MVDPHLAPDYLRVDFVENELKLKPPWSNALAHVIASLSTPLLRATGCIPVYPDAARLRKTFEISLTLLQEGKCLLIFPEDPTLPADPITHMTPFKKGFALLGEWFYHRTRERLRFYPLAVHESRCVMVGQPVTYDPLNPTSGERLRIKRLIEHSVREMYLAISFDEPSLGLGMARSVR